MQPAVSERPLVETQRGPSAEHEQTIPLRPPKVAYFSMEIALEAAMPTYSGGLGVLAGDTLRSAADLGVPMVGVTLLHRKGYFEQVLDRDGNQTERAAEWEPSELLTPIEPTVNVTIAGRPVHVRCWRHFVYGASGHIVPVYLLDTDISPNTKFDRSFTDHLYGGDAYYRLCQEMLLGVGGIEMLRRLGHADIETYHMNEGHSALLVLRLLEQQMAVAGVDHPSDDDVLLVRKKCVFTTHTPVAAGHDQFAGEMVTKVLGAQRAALLFSTGLSPGNSLNMTHLALHHSNYVNGVAMRHGEVSRGMFPHYRIKALTNGVHAGTWTSPAFRELFDREIPEWRHDNVYLRYAINIPLNEIREAHKRAKAALLAAIRDKTGVELDPNVLTIGFARRATGYKRADMIFKGLQRLERIGHEAGPIQIVYGGKAHPRDDEGKEQIRRIFRAGRSLRSVKVVYVQNYDMAWAMLICSGVDLWLNTPQPTREASGTSGMKAALNGVPSLSILDGWWIEGHLEGMTGWAIEDRAGKGHGEIESLYNKLEQVILPMYYQRPDEYAAVMRSAMALNGSFFNTQRMLLQYVFNAYSSNGKG